MTSSERRIIDFEKSRFSTAKKAELQRVIKRLERAIADMRKDFGIRVPNSDLVKILEKVEDASEGQVLRMSKSWISDICTGYKKYWNAFDDLPAHTMIEIDPGTFRQKRGDISWFLLEAAVYEDMCALFNQAKEIESKLNTQGYDKKSFKTRDSLLRATVLTAFHFVEAYLNGLAFDYYASKQDEISDETRAILFDWNPKTNKPKYLSLRDKALQYPKIILVLEHPPLRPDNCPELKCVLEAVDIRHRLTHISPMREFERALSDEYAQVYTVRLTEVEKIIDS